MGLKRARFRVLAGVEIDPLAAATYRDNHPRVQLWERDIRDLSVAEILRRLDLRPGMLDLLAGCPPCQGFSIIRTRNSGKPVADDRNDLVLEFVRLARGLRPKAIMLENVPGLASDQRFLDLCERLREFGFVVGHRTRNAADFGVPQRRKRLILLAGRRAAIAFPSASASRRTVRDMISELPSPGNTGDPLHDLIERRSTAVLERIKVVPTDGEVELISVATSSLAMPNSTAFTTSTVECTGTRLPRPLPAAASIHRRGDSCIRRRTGQSHFARRRSSKAFRRAIASDSIEASTAPPR